MIPKIIHYVWLGGENNQPDEVKRSIESWYKLFKDYDIIKYDESNISEYMDPLVSKLLEDHKYAFVSDILRLKILKKNPGIYLDTDQEFVKPFTEDMLSQYAFVGCELPKKIGTTVIAVSSPDDKIINKMLSFYDNIKDASEIPYNPEIITSIFQNLGFSIVRKNHPKIIDGWKIYPKDVFHPFGYWTTEVTDQSISYHHWLGSAIDTIDDWKSWIDKKFKENEEVMRKFRGY